MAEGPRGLKGFHWLLIAVAVVGIGILGWQVSRPRSVSIPANVAVLPADTAGFHGYYLGSDSAPVTITEYADYQCPACQSFELVTFPDVKARLIDTGKVRWRYRDFPLSIHDFSRVAAHAAACANDQGKFWQVHHLLYEGQPDWAGGGGAGTIRNYASAAGLDLARYDECMKSARYAGRIEASFQEAESVGANSTPTFLIAGRLYPGALPFDFLNHLVDSLLAARAR